jgi:hypothetical protein
VALSVCNCAAPQGLRRPTAGSALACPPYTDAEPLSLRLRPGLEFLFATSGARMRYTTMSSLGWYACGSERPKYPSPPRSGNAFAAAVVTAIADLLFLIALFEWWPP